ncbi:hypothetical protein BHE97_02235 [Aeromicrobium sp. PE09-221]|uniref:hypothetical protein n=1 Tax=Aeromicrobium sp. PE09-221 TaxID=1898043 RepID=UPI000B3E5A42|nr:hypothetical protein [Aeromicrobium sp. PE09-221]OUZ12539.1 hypothetical protein BHE97_02235 [Aeromicrobium sp. PE09-221]
MSSPGVPGAHRMIRIVLRVLAAAAAAVCGIAFVVLVALVLGSLFGPVSRDPHGYAMIFGLITAVPAGLLTAVFLPLAFPPRQRRRVTRLGTWIVVAILIALFAILFTA